MNTSSEVRVPIDKERIICNWDLTKVTKRMQRDQQGRMLPYEMYELEEQYRHYLMCLAVHPGKVVPVSKPVDEYWHTHMLFSDDYASLAQMLFPGKGIEHVPTLSDEEEAALLPQYYAVTIPTLTALFGQPSITLWPSHHCVCGGNGGGS